MIVIYTVIGVCALLVLVFYTRIAMIIREHNNLAEEIKENLNNDSSSSSVPDELKLFGCISLIYYTSRNDSKFYEMIEFINRKLVNIYGIKTGFAYPIVYGYKADINKDIKYIDPSTVIGTVTIEPFMSDGSGLCTATIRIYSRIHNDLLKRYNKFTLNYIGIKKNGKNQIPDKILGFTIGMCDEDEK